MTVISKHSCFGEALDACFAHADGDALAVRHVDGQWCLVRDTAALEAFERAERNAPHVSYGTDGCI